MFSCTTRDVSGHWRLNGTYIGDLPSAIRADLETGPIHSDVFYFLALSILGRFEYNETRVQCAFVNGGGSLEESETAFLSIQGD